MTKHLVAVPVGVLFLSLSISSSGQSFEDTRGVPVAPKPAQSQATPNSAVITVHPEITDDQMGDLLMVRKEYREAAEIYKRLSDEHPKSAVYLNKLGIALHQQAALGLALKYYEKSAKMDPKYADAQNNIGTIWYQRKKYGKSIRAYKKAITIRTDMAVLYSNLGYAYFSDKKYEEAIASFRQALNLDPQLFENGHSRSGSILQNRSVDDRGRFYFLLAKSFAQAGNVERCLVYLRKAKDEGYKQMNEAKSDPAFAAVLKNPEIQEVLAPLPAQEAETKP